MNATELIAALQALVAEHGDRPVTVFDTDEFRPVKPPAISGWGRRRNFEIEADWDNALP